jgi:hypothetical protein
VNLSQIKEKIHKEILLLRSIERILVQEEFEVLWSKLDTIDQWVFEDVIKDKDRIQIIRLIKRNPALELGERSLSELKHIAKMVRLKNYSRLTKYELVALLKEESK